MKVSLPDENEVAPVAAGARGRDGREARIDGADHVGVHPAHGLALAEHGGALETVARGARGQGRAVAAGERCGGDLQG
jgi:hypothetical protein